MPDQLLAASHQVAVVEAAARDAPVDALDEATVFNPDLVVEGHQLVDPLLIDLGAEEVVEKAIGPVRADRDHRAERDVRLPREDVHPEVRPQEVELAPRQLAVEMHP